MKKITLGNLNFNLSLKHYTLDNINNLQIKLNQRYNSKNSCDKFTYKIFDIFLDKDHSCLDIGAYNGIYTTFYMSNYSKKVYAFECDYIAINTFKEHLKVNNFNNIILYEGAIYNKTGKVYVGEGGKKRKFGSSGVTLLNNQNEKNKKLVNSITINDFFNKYNINDCNFIKMDIEGGEYYVIPTMYDILSKYKITLFLSLHHHLYKNTDEILKTLINIYGEKNIYDPLTLKNFKDINIIKKPYNKHGRDILCTFNVNKINLFFNSN